MTVRDLLTEYTRWMRDNRLNPNNMMPEDFRAAANRFMDERGGKSPVTPPPTTGRQTYLAGTRNPYKKKPFGTRPPRAPRARTKESQDFVLECERTIESAQDLPSECDARFSWINQLNNMRDWAHTNGHVTEKMKKALENIADGVQRWE